MKFKLLIVAMCFIPAMVMAQQTPVTSPPVTNSRPTPTNTFAIPAVTNSPPPASHPAIIPRDPISDAQAKYRKYVIEDSNIRFDEISSGVIRK